MTNEMKTNRNILTQAAAAVAVAAAATLVACTDDLGLGFINQVHNPSEEICFTTSGIVGQAREPFTRHAGYVEETAEEWEITGTDTCSAKGGTRADAQNSLYDYFANAGVRIFLYDGAWDTSNTSCFQVPAAADLETTPALPGTFDESGLLSPEEPILWTSSKAQHEAVVGGNAYFEHFRAYALAPMLPDARNGNRSIHDLIAAGYAAYAPGGMGVPPSIAYKVPAEPKDQVDLVGGSTGELRGDYCAAVPLTFRHALSAVQFRLGFEETVRVKSLTISGLFRSGRFVFNDAGEIEVTPIKSATPVAVPGDALTDAPTGDDAYGYTFSYTASGENYTEYAWNSGSASYPGGNALNDGNNTLMLIPQTLPEGATVILEYSKDDGSGNWVSKTISCDISGFQWKPGYRYIYTIKEEPSYDIFFDLAAGPVSICKNAYSNSGKYEYSGKVYVGGVATNVQGIHSGSNKYYVYQSTGEDNGSYDKYHTGWESTLGAGICNIPEYPEMKLSDGKVWADYVTNNTDVDAVRTNWDVVATGVGRNITSNHIKVYSDHSLGDLKVDMTIDNVWIDASEGGSQNYESNNIDYFSMCFAQKEVGNKSFYEHEKITLKLKGDNKCASVFFRGYSYETQNVGAAYLYVTSYQGDGSIKGSLTVTADFAVASRQTSVNCATTRFGGQNLTPYNYHYQRGLMGLEFKGGTVYVGGPETNQSGNYMVTSSALCAGGNCPAKIDIIGGRITSIGKSRSPAIGGGLGRMANAAKGIVTITGGEVYAYGLGDYEEGQSVVPSTAIGGGSTVEGNVSTSLDDKSIVTITGGKVYAYSVGGCALGGGNSYRKTGGHAEVNIGGTAEVYAISAPGKIYSYDKSSYEDVPASTSIGGGTGGNYSGYNGGNAFVRIYGNPKVYAGSVGGGSMNNPSGKKGYADIEVSGSPDVQMQALMQSGSSGLPSFSMSGGYLHLSDKTIPFVEPNGGAVWMDDGICSITGGTIDGFKAQNGGAVYMEGGTFTMTGGTIRNCRAQYNSASGSGGKGGAVYINDASGAATVNIQGGNISGNYADWNGGGIYLEGGNVNITSGTVGVNKALGASGIAETEKGNGGGIYLTKGNFMMSAGQVEGNSAIHDGGGIYVSSESTDIGVDISGGSIVKNVSEHMGAGLFVKPGAGRKATVNIGAVGEPYSQASPLISGNSAALRGGGIYAEGADATVNLYDGRIKDNYVSAYVYNQSIANEGGHVSLALDGDGLPVPDLDFITVAYDPNGGDFEDGNTAGTPAFRYLVTSTNSMLTPPTPKRKNFRFIGWLPSIGKSSTTKDPSDYLRPMLFNFYKDITLTAQWELAM